MVDGDAEVDETLRVGFVEACTHTLRLNTSTGFSSNSTARPLVRALQLRGRTGRIQLLEYSTGMNLSFGNRVARP